MGLADPPPANAALALLPRASPDADHGITIDLPPRACLSAWCALLLSYRVRSKVDPGFSFATLAGGHCRHHSPQNRRWRHAGQSPTSLARVDDRLFCVS